MIHLQVLLLTPAEGLAAQFVKFLNGIAKKASPLSSAQQPMDQVF
jgi:hypothetical protein